MLQTGATAPDFTLPDLSGRQLRLSDVISRGPVLLAFYKISCPTCQLTMPFLDRISGAGAPEVIAISQDDRHSTEGFRQQFGSTVPTLIDAGPGYPVSKAYGLTHVPSLFWIQPDGRVKKAVDGFSRADLEELGVSFTPEDQVPAVRPG